MIREVLDWNRRDDYMPYWAYLWPGAYLLAEAVAREPWLRRRLDRGASSARDRLRARAGRPGCAGEGLGVQFTDYDRAPLEFVARSAAENGFDPIDLPPAGSIGGTSPTSGFRSFSVPT